MKYAVTILLALSFCLPALTADEPDADRYDRSVVGLNVTYQMWDEDRPWAKMTPQSRSGSAVLLEGSYLLTDAQMVDHATLIQLATFGRSRPVEPVVVAVDKEVNLALLRVDDRSALEGLEPIRLAE